MVYRPLIIAKLAFFDKRFLECGVFVWMRSWVCDKMVLNILIQIAIRCSGDRLNREM